MKSLHKRIDDVEQNLSGFKGAADRMQAIRYLKSLDPDIKAEEIVSIEDYYFELKSHFAPIPGTPAYDEWLGSDLHKKYVKRQKKKQEEQAQV